MTEAPKVEELRSHDGLKIINAGLFRTATKSMACAYQILGFKAHHGLLEDVTETPWTGIEHAAEAKWPAVCEPGTSRSAFQRSDWDAIWGSKYDAVTDLASPFAPELIKAYPNAKVVIVQRDFDSWWASFKPEILDRVMVQPMATINGFIGWRIMGIRAVQAMRKVHFGFFHAKSPDQIDTARARETYDAYYHEIRTLVPPERKLEYKMGDGWEPLCAFLGVDVPQGVAFPRENDQANHGEEAEARLKKFRMSLAKVAIPCFVGVAAIVAGWLYLSKA